ncbi:MAG: EamA family transporter [Hyphomicrobiales bacterium]
MTSKTSTNLALAITFAFLSTLNYGLNPPIVRLAFENGVPVLTSGLLRAVTMVVFASLFIFLTGRSFQVPNHHRLPVFLLGLATGAVSLCYLSAVAFIPVGIATIIFFTFPIILLLVSPLLEGESISPRRIGLAVLALIGLAIVLGPAFDGLDWRGVVLAVCAAFGATAQFLTGRHIADGVRPNTAAFWANLVSIPAIACAIFVVHGLLGFSDLLSPFEENSTAIFAVVLVCITYVFAFQLQMASLHHGPASVVAPFFYLEPIISISVAAVFLGQHLQPAQYAGGAIVFIALIGSAWVSKTPVQTKKL